MEKMPSKVSCDYPDIAALCKATFHNCATKFHYTSCSLDKTKSRKRRVLAEDILDDNDA